MAEHEHLDAASWAALQRREPAAVAHFARHLAQPCEVCEAFLAGSPEGGDALEALADESLGALAREDAGEELGWARVRRELGPAVQQQPQRRAPRRAWAARAVGLAAVAALALVVVRVAPWRGEQEQGFRIKGQRPVSLELSATVQLPDGRVLPVAEGEPLPPEGVLLLRYTAEEPARALLVMQAAEGAPRVLGRFTLQPGAHDLDEGGELAGVSLEGESGPLTVALVVAPAGESVSEEPAQLQAALAGEREAGGTVVARLHVRVEPGHTLP
ncbi:hypothetical protein FGE12_26520 [Aggregicoccus sp. 17bor-14]|uniref:hypothetical protein n=1 Tax=Myxococcaceae TaxID=31 RepID=UPI00129C5A69|nr:MULTISPECIES: hypothetical protein [Myxococcaceae]MBF5045995.1 hypothetical protein [Simulacricoccus sp. 17bor-14]MRI91726.1 hypothetical protein [Aggregicoccus sp. 17bor-14]